MKKRKRSYKEFKEAMKEMERVINISETVKRETRNRNNENEPRNPSPSSSRSYSDRFHFSSRAKGLKEHILEEGQ